MTTPHAALIARLRARPLGDFPPQANDPVAHEAATAIESQAARIQELERELAGEKWRAENFRGCFEQQEERAKAAERAASEAREKALEEAAVVFDKFRDGDEWFGVNEILRALKSA